MSHESVVLRAAHSATDDGSAPHGRATSRGTSWHVLLLAGRHEARWLAASPFVLAGLVVSGWLIWLNNRVVSLPVQLYGLGQPGFWWAADVSIAACLLAAAGGVLIAAQLAAGRASRDGMEQLYASYPTAAPVRTGAQLIGVAGPVVLAAVLTAAAVGWLDSQGTLGAPRLWVLGAGLLLVVLAGAVGVALGRWVPHPMAGLLAVLVLGLIEVDLVLSVANPIHLPGGIAWLFPWTDPGSLLTALPGVTVPYPPPVHLAELAGLIALAAVASVWRAVAHRGVAVVVAAVALVVTCLSGWLEARPVPAAVLGVMSRQVLEPGSVQRCQLVGRVRYCYYPAFAPLVGQWAVAVDGVLTRLPPNAKTTLTVRQVWDDNFMVPPLLSPTGLTSNGPAAPTTLSAALGGFQSDMALDGRLIPGSSVPPVYTDASWGSGSSLGRAQFALAVSTAEWATGLPTTGRSVSYSVAFAGGGGESGTDVLACVPVGQARQSIALWLAAGATPATRRAFGAAGAAGSTQVGKRWIATVAEPGSGPLVGLLATAQGAALAAEMLRLPDHRVEAVLAADWRYWLRPQATAAELAAALGLTLPAQPVARPQVVTASYGTYAPPTQVCR